MAANYVSKIKLGSSIYSLKDEEVRAAVSVLETAVSSSLIFKGVANNATGITGLTNYKLGWTYKANANFTIDNLGKVESGDMIICINSNSTYSASDWTIIQNNVDIMNGATSAAGGTKGLVPAPAAGEQNKFLSGNGTWQDAGIAWGNLSELD